jgi:hypothetical protein
MNTDHMPCLSSCHAQYLISQVAWPNIYQSLKFVRSSNVVDDPLSATINGVKKDAIGDIAISIADVFTNRY